MSGENVEVVRSIYAAWARGQAKTEWTPGSRSPVINEGGAAAERLAESRG